MPRTLVRAGRFYELKELPRHSSGHSSHRLSGLIEGDRPRHRPESRNLLSSRISRPRYTVRFKWAAGSIAFWDNRSLIHMARDIGFERRSASALDDLVVPIQIRCVPLCSFRVNLYSLFSSAGKLDSFGVVRRTRRPIPTGVLLPRTSGEPQRIFSVKLYCDRSNILLKVLNRGSTRNGYGHWRMGQEPGQSNLSGCRVVFIGELR
jgi:hypothetical protein